MNNFLYDATIQCGDDIPVICVNDRSIAGTWERSLTKLYYEGCNIKTEYDNPNDPPSIDATMILTVLDPLSESMIHRDLPGGLEDLQEYVMEVCDGIKDHWVDPLSNTKWQYTYHQRFTKFYGIDSVINQLDNMVNKLAENPYSRRAQAITWDIEEDNKLNDPPCVQSIWGRIVNDKFCMNVRIRSNDAYRAAPMNLFAFTMLQQKMAQQISTETRKNIRVGRLCWMADSYHIYGKDLKEFEQRFLKSIEKRTFEERTFEYKKVKLIMDEAIPHILQKIAKYDAQ